MRRTLRNVIASAITAGMLLSVGCDRNKGREPEYVKEDDLWYSSKSMDLMGALGSIDDIVKVDTPVVAGGRIYMNTISNIEGENKSHFTTHVFGADGEHLADFEVAEEIPKSDYLCLSDEGDKAVIYYSSEGSLYKADVVIGAESSSNDGVMFQNAQKIDVGDDGVKFIVSVSFDGYNFMLGRSNGDGWLYVLKDDKVAAKRQIDLPYAMEPNIIPVDKGYQILADYETYLFDPGEGKIKNYGLAGMDSFEYAVRDRVKGSDGRTYVKKDDGIYADGELILTYFNTDCNPAEFIEADLIKVTDDKIELCTYTDDYGRTIFSPCVIELQKENMNPNTGKTVITAHSYNDRVDHMTGEALRLFNQTNKEYFIRFEVQATEDMAEDESAEKAEQRLKEEIVSSDAADIYFGTDSLWWFQKDDYFVDLKKYIELDKDTYYTSIIDGMSRDGRLYSMPLDFWAEGIVAERSDVKEGARGFTYEEYLDLVSKVGNGIDPISDTFSRMDYFEMCFSMMNDTWFKDGGVDIANGSFESLCDYIVNNVSEVPRFSDSDWVDGTAAFSEQAGFQYVLTGPTDCWNYQKYEDPVLLGLPTEDGRGPAAHVTASVSVSAVSDLKEGCIDFVKLLLSEEVQDQCSINPINRNSLSKVLDISAKRCEKDFWLMFESESEGARYDNYLPDEKAAEAYRKMLDNVEVVSATDPSVQAVVREELSAAMADQKDLKDIEKILEDRLKTLMSEKNS